MKMKGSPPLQLHQPPASSGQWPRIKYLLMLALAGLAGLTVFSTCNLRSSTPAPSSVNKDRIVKVAEQQYTVVEKKNSGNSSIVRGGAGDPFALAMSQSFGE